MKYSDMCQLVRIPHRESTKSVGQGEWFLNEPLKFLIMNVDLKRTVPERLIGVINVKTGEITVDKRHPVTFTCQSSVECCSKLSVPITDFDIKRIEDQGFAIGQIVEELTPLLDLPQSDAGNIEKYYWIKRKPFTNTCTFLKDNRCSIYEFRPYACRIFPFSLRAISPDKIMVLTHPSKLCSNIDTKKDFEGNKKILNQILKFVREDRQLRSEYFSKYGRKI